MKRVLLLLMVLLPFLCGCANRKLEEELLVIVLAIDYSAQDGVTAAVKVPSISSAAGNSQDAEKQGGEEGYMLLQATGHTFPDAISMLNATTPRQLNFSQVREVVIGLEAAKRPDFAALLRQIDGLPRFRCSAAVIICKEKALDFAKAQKPYVGMRLSRYAENTLSNYAGKGFTPAATLCDGVRDLGYGYQDPLFIWGAVNDFSNETSAQESNSLSAQAGSLPRKSTEAVEMFGAAATDGVSVRGTLTGYEMALLHLLSGHVEALVLRDGDNSVRVTAGLPAALGVDVNRRPLLLTVSLLCQAQYPPGSVLDREGLKARLENDIAAVIAHLQRLGCDGAGFGNVAVKHFLTISQWESLRWREAYAQAEVSVRVDVQCRSN